MFTFGQQNAMTNAFLAAKSQKKAPERGAKKFLPFETMEGTQ